MQNLRDDVYFETFEQLINYLTNCNNSFVVKITEEKEVINNQNDIKIKKIENGIEIPSNNTELWEKIKKFIPTTITTLDIPFSYIENNMEFLYYLPNLTTLTLNDNCDLKLETIKFIKEQTQIKNINIKNVPTNIYAWKLENGFTHLGYPYSFVDYYGLKIYPDTKEDVQMEIECDTRSIDIQSYDLKSDAVKEFYNMTDPKLKKIVRLSSISSIYDIKFKKDKEIEQIVFKGESYDKVISVYNDLQAKGYSIEKVVYQFTDNNYYNFDTSNFEELSKQCNLSFRYDESTNYNDTSYNDFINLQMCINWYRKLILDYNLSPCEKLMFAYDILKTFEYHEENEKMDNKMSRDPSEIMKTGYIVCVGYSKLLEEILKGIDPNLAVTTFSIPEHRRNIVRIDDEKYNIHGVYCLDATWDNARNAKEEGYSSLDLYSYFLISNNQYEDVLGDEFPEIYKYVNNKEKIKRFKLSKELTMLFGTDDVNKEKITKYVNVDRPSLENFTQMLINVRMAEGYTKEQALTEAQNIVKINQEVAASYSQDGIKFNFFEQSKHTR